MKKIMLYIIFSIFLKISYSKPYSDLSTKPKVNKIEFARSGYMGLSDMRQLPENNNYIMIIEQNGNAILKWNGKCPPSRNNILICSYKGNITKKQFKTLCKKLYEINFIDLQEEYKPLYETEHSPYIADSFEIMYNNVMKKNIVDRNQVDVLKEFKEMIFKLRKEVKWVANK
jgi:hypothetical protein